MRIFLFSLGILLITVTFLGTTFTFWHELAWATIGGIALGYSLKK